MSEYKVGEIVQVVNEYVGELIRKRNPYYGMLFIVEEPKPWGVLAYSPTHEGLLYVRLANEEIKSVGHVEIYLHEVSFKE